MIKAKRELNARQKSLLRVCRTLALPLLLIALISQQFLIGAGLLINDPTGQSEIQFHNRCHNSYMFAYANNRQMSYAIDDANNMSRNYIQVYTFPDVVPTSDAVSN